MRDVAYPRPGAGIECGMALPGGRECFLETTLPGANGRTFHCVRPGVLIS